MSRTATRSAAGALAIALLASHSALAQGEDARRPRFEIAAGAFFTSSDTGLRVDSNVLGLGTRLDLEDDLGFDRDDTAARVDAIWRLGSRRRHRLDASYFRLSREARRVIDREIQFGDRVYQLNADIRADLELDVFKLDYTYMFLQNERGELGGSVGVFGIGQSASLSEATLGGRETSDLTFPLPTIGLRGDVSLSERFILKASADAFFIDTGEYNGQLYDGLVAIEFDAFRNVGFGLGYNYAYLDVGASRDEGDASLDLTYDGALAYLKLMF